MSDLYFDEAMERSVVPVIAGQEGGREAGGRTVLN